MSADQIHACLSFILSEQNYPKREDCVGSLTTLERDRWADVRFSCAAYLQSDHRYSSHFLKMT